MYLSCLCICAWVCLCVFVCAIRLDETPSSPHYVDNFVSIRIYPGTAQHVCDCNAPAQSAVCSHSANAGRLFYRCASRKCEFFEWTNDVFEGDPKPRLEPEVQLWSCPSCGFGQVRNIGHQFTRTHTCMQLAKSYSSCAIHRSLYSERRAHFDVPLLQRGEAAYCHHTRRGLPIDPPTRLVLSQCGRRCTGCRTNWNWCRRVGVHCCGYVQHSTQYRR